MIFITLSVIFFIRANHRWSMWRRMSITTAMMWAFTYTFTFFFAIIYMVILSKFIILTSKLLKHFKLFTFYFFESILHSTKLTILCLYFTSITTQLYPNISVVLYSFLFNLLSILLLFAICILHKCLCSSIVLAILVISNFNWLGHSILTKVFYKVWILAHIFSIIQI